MTKSKYGESEYSQRGAEGYPLTGLNKAIRTADGKTIITSYDIDGQPRHSEIVDYHDQQKTNGNALIKAILAIGPILMLAIGVGLAVFL